MTLLTHFQTLNHPTIPKVYFYLLTSPKFDFGEVEKALFQMFAKHWGIIYFLLTNPKCDLCEVKKAMFQGLACHFELTFGLLANPKCDLDESKARMALSTYFEPLGQPKVLYFKG